MSAHDDDVLGRNLRRLLTRSYRPVVPATDFRDRLAQRLEKRTQHEGASGGSRPAPAQEPRGVGLRIVAVAAVLLILACGFLGYNALFRGERDPGVILARGGVALLHTNSRFWKDVDPLLVRRGLDVGSEGFNVLTPSGVELTIRFGHFGSVVVGPSSHAAIFGNEAHPPTVFLLAGSARVENTAGEPAWGLDSSVANVIVERGKIRARLDACKVGATNETCLVVTLARGVARAGALGQEMHQLQLGVETSISATRVLSALVVDESPASATVRRAAALPGDSVEKDSAPAAVRNGFATLAGTIESARDASPIGRYSVTILRKERLPAVATPKRYEFDGAQRFSIHPVKPGRYDVFVEIAGSSPWIARSLELVPETTHELNVQLDSGACVRGRVVDARDGAPIENALVIVEDLVPAQVILFDADERYWSASARTNASGEFRLDHIPPGAHILRATAPGFAAAWTPRATVQASDAVELRLARPGSIAGLVVREDGTPWRGAIVIASFMRNDSGLERFSYGAGVTDAGGRYAIADLPAGDYVILNALDTSAGRETMASKVAHVAANLVTTVNLPDAVDGARFEGRVVDATGNPIGALDVTLQPQGVDDDSSWRSMRASTDGHFVFQGLPSGTYDVFVGLNLGERFIAVDAVTVPLGGVLVHDIRLAGGSIRGRATSKDASIANAFVLLERMERDRHVFAGRGRTDAHGAFDFSMLSPATYRVSVFPSEKGFAPGHSADLWVVAGAEPTICELVVLRGATLNILVRDANGSPIADAPLTFVDSAGHAQRFGQRDSTDAAGRYVVVGLAAGTWRVTATDRAGRTAARTIDLYVGDERDVVLELP